MKHLGDQQRKKSIIVVTEADLDAWKMDRTFLSLHSNHQISESDIPDLPAVNFNHELVKLFVSSVNQKKWRVVLHPEFYKQLPKKFHLRHSSYLFITPLVPLDELVFFLKLAFSLRTLSILLFRCFVRMKTWKHIFSFLHFRAA